MVHDLKCGDCRESIKVDVEGDILVLRCEVEHEADGHKLMLKLCDKQGNVVVVSVEKL